MIFPESNVNCNLFTDTDPELNIGEQMKDEKISFLELS